MSVAINYWELFGSLKMGLGVLPTTDPDIVPHSKDPMHIPKYTVRGESGSVVRSGPVDELVDWVYASLGVHTLHEDEYPVFTVWG